MMFGTVRSTAILALLALLVLPTVFVKGASAWAIGDFVWNDLNADGIQDPDEPGIDGVIVHLYKQHDDGTVEHICTYKTFEYGAHGHGYYTFDYWVLLAYSDGKTLSAGDYFLEFVAPDGYVFSPQDQGGDDTVDSDVDGSGRTDIITLTEDYCQYYNYDVDAGLYKPGPPPSGEGCGTPGYWKTHPENWPVEEVAINGETYTKAEAIDWMDAPTKGDKTVIMFAALVAAKLNVAEGNDDSCIADTIEDADDWMAAYGPVGSGVKDWNGGEALYLDLDDYNNGRLPCAPSK